MIEVKDVKMKGNTDVKVPFIESDDGKVTEYVVSSNEAPLGAYLSDSTERKLRRGFPPH